MDEESTPVTSFRRSARAKRLLDHALVAGGIALVALDIFLLLIWFGTTRSGFYCSFNQTPQRQIRTDIGGGAITITTMDSSNSPLPVHYFPGRGRRTYTYSPDFWQSFTYVDSNRGGNYPYRLVVLSIPIWACFAAVTTLTPLVAWWRWRPNLPPGHCEMCGYDLRASPKRCPECGSVSSNWLPR